MSRSVMPRLMASAVPLSMLLCSAAACQSPPPAGDAPDSAAADQRSALVVAAARPVAPLSGSVAGSRRPIFRWAGARTAVFEVCADRACARPIQIFTGANGSARPPEPLPIGVVFWRLLASLDGGRLAYSPVWELFVPRSGTAPAAVRGLRYDADGDGFADAAVSEQDEDQAVSRVHVFSGGPDGISAARDTVIDLDPSAFGVGFSAAGDLDGDGFGDLALASGGGVQVFAGSANGPRATPETVLLPPDGASPSDFGFHVEGAGDVDGDGYGDLVVSDFSQHVWVYAGSAAGLGATPIWTFNTGGISTVRVGTTGDLDGDGFGDLVLTETDSVTERLHVFHGGPAGLGAPDGGTTIPWPRAATTATAGDINGDGISNLLISDGTSIFMFAGGPGAPTGTPLASSRVTPPPFLGPLESADFDGDGFFDLAVTSTAPTSQPFFTDDQVSVYAGARTGLAPTPRTTLVETAYFPDDHPNFGERLSGADFDGDHRDDLLLGAPPPFPTPIFDNSPGVLFVFPGLAGGGVDGTAQPRIEGLPGFANQVSAAAPQPAP